MMMTPIRRAWALSLLWIGVIALESFGGSAENTGHLLFPLLKLLFPKITVLLMDTIHYSVRKAGHFLGYSILSLALYRSWWVTLASRAGAGRFSWSDMRRDWSWRAAVLALLGTLAVAAGDEWHQSFVPGRGASMADVCLDEFGGILAQLLILIVSAVAISKNVRQRKAASGQPITSV